MTSPQTPPPTKERSLTGFILWVLTLIIPEQVLIECPKSTKTEARTEVFITMGLAFSPVLLGTLLQMVTSNSWDAISITRASLNGGEIFIYCSAMLAPVMCMIYKYSLKNAVAPNALKFFIYPLITLVISGVIFGSYKAKTIQNHILVELLSWLLFFISLIQFYGATVMQKVEFDYSKVANQDSNDLLRKFNTLNPR